MLPTYGTPIKSLVAREAFISKRQKQKNDRGWYDWDRFKVSIPVGTLGYIARIRVTNVGDEYSCRMIAVLNGKKCKVLQNFSHSELTDCLTDKEVASVKRPPNSDKIMTNFEVVKLSAGKKVSSNFEEDSDESGMES